VIEHYIPQASVSLPCDPITVMCNILCLMAPKSLLKVYMPADSVMSNYSETLVGLLNRPCILLTPPLNHFVNSVTKFANG